MNYTEAVALAKAGEERGFEFLYENTYKTKYYLALQYMKNEETAQDVVQDAYIKAFSKLDTLKEPETFPAWLGRIVANTAKNVLVKKNPMLFSEMQDEDEEERFEYRIEDDSVETQPELSYTRQETRELVRELIDSLSEEQRMCILMFHIEGDSISEIADVLGCSENTVKSRLNYGRRNLKKKAEDLQKKGYKLYSAAPLPLLLYLLRARKEELIADGTLEAAGRSMASSIFRFAPQTGDTGSMQPEAGNSSQAGAGTRTGTGTLAGAGSQAAKTAAVKAGVIHTAAVKAAVVIVGVSLTGAVIFGVSQAMKDKGDPAVSQQEEQSQEEQPQEEPDIPQAMQDGDYTNLIAGNITKEEMGFVLGYGPQEIPEGGFTEEDYRNFLNCFCAASSDYGGPIESYGVDENWVPGFSLDDVNRLFASFTDYRFTEENDDNEEFGIDVEGNEIRFAPASLSYTAEAEITSGEYTASEMTLYYTYERNSMGGDPSSQTVRRKAVLTPAQDGLYRIVRIEEMDDASDSGESGGDTAEQNNQAEETGFPAGDYSYVALAGGLRTSMTVEPSGAVTIREMSSYNGETTTTTYQMSVDNTATVSDGITAYVLKSVDGGEDREITYDAAQGILYDVTYGFEWTKV